MPETDTKQLYSTFIFEVSLSARGTAADDVLFVADAAFSQVSGLETTIEVVALREGGYNVGERRLIGKTSHGALVLKRGVTRNAGFWTWVQRCLDGTFPLPYVDGEIRVYPPDRNAPDAEAATWRFRNGIATKVRSADLNAVSASEVPIEELHIVHEHLERIR